MWMKSTPLPCHFLATDCDDLDDRAARARLAVERRRERDDERPLRGHRRRHGRAQEVAVGRLGRRDRLRVDARPECRVPGRDRAVADRRRGRPLADDEVPERLDLLPPDRLGEDPVGPGRRRVDRGDVDVLRVGRRSARYADRLELRCRLRRTASASTHARSRHARSDARSPWTACRRRGTRRDSYRARSRMCLRRSRRPPRVHARAPPGSLEALRTSWSTPLRFPGRSHRNRRERVRNRAR